ncbi:hypothetical protein PENTCL1PPCAC_8038, partial [Pristionchus entomophagus]
SGFGKDRRARKRVHFHWKSSGNGWYENHKLLPSDQLSADDGDQWSSIVSLLRRNGPAFPFTSLDDEQPYGIDIAREV